MHIIYAVSSCTNRAYRQLFANAKKKPAYHTQKYHRLMIEGLAANAHVDVVATPPVNRAVLHTNFVKLPDEEEGGAHYTYVTAARNPYLKVLLMAFGTFWKTWKLAKKDSAVVVDCLNRTVSLFALLAARLRGVRCVGIVTDLPDMLDHDSFVAKLSNFIIRHCTDYILLTEAMAEYLKVGHKPYVVLEGQSDIQMESAQPSMAQKLQPKVCMYAGCISADYGLWNLIKGFQKTKLDAQLHLYGPCDFEEELAKISQEDPRIVYGGMLLNTEIVEKEMEASLLVNPRPTHEEYVKYSFPSKTMEYMSTGTPVLTTVLPGMPKEYHPYVYLLEEETEDGITKRLEQLLVKSDEELFRKGCEARAFILNEKNNVVQAKKILTMLENRRK